MSCFLLRGYSKESITSLPADMARENRYCVETVMPFKRVVSAYTDLDEFVGLLLDAIDCT